MENAKTQLREIQLALKHCDLDYEEILEDYREHIREHRERIRELKHRTGKKYSLEKTDETSRK
ncbi:hypothetical protein KJ966_24950 [bacterium]|nr:hypothetical protein [bacterium]